MSDLNILGGVLFPNLKKWRPQIRGHDKNLTKTFNQDVKNTGTIPAELNIQP
jgi:hypothetical protein